MRGFSPSTPYPTFVTLLTVAIYHYSVQLLSRSKGQSAIAAAAYRAGAKLKDDRTGLSHDYTRKAKVAHTEILAPPNAPAWVGDREQLWNQVEAAERRKDSQVVREVNLALPKELTLEQGLELLRGFVQEQFVNQGMVADLAVHWLDENPHAHVMLTTRSLDLESGRFGQKNREWNQKELLEAQRKAWAIHVNRALAKTGVKVRIDHRRLVAQGITDRQAQIHQGRIIGLMKRKGRKTLLIHPRWLRYQQIERVNGALAKVKAEIEAETQQLEKRGVELLARANFVLGYAKRNSLKGERYHLSQNQIKTNDGRGVLVSRQGDRVVVSDQTTEEDFEFIRQQAEEVRKRMAVQRSKSQQR